MKINSPYDALREIADRWPTLLDIHEIVTAGLRAPMPTVIERRAGDLQPGDILAVSKHVVLKVTVDGLALLVHCATLGQANGFARLSMNAQEVVHVSARGAATLTPAQEHAEELLALTRYALDPEMGICKLGDMARELLDKINPPKPPTLEEALALLEGLDAWGDQKREFAPSNELVMLAANAKALLRRRGGK